VHRPTVAIDPEVTLDADLPLSRSTRVERGSVNLKPPIEVRRQLRRDGGMVRSAGLRLPRAELQAVFAAVEHQVLADHQVRQILDPHRGRGQEPDDQTVAVTDSHVYRPIGSRLAGVHERDPQLEQVRGTDQPGELVP
jgi:hypothetical protein